MDDDGMPMQTDSSPVAARRRGWLSIRRWQILGALLYLHLRFYWFQPAMLSALSEARYTPLLRLDPTEFRWANHWNNRISAELQRLRSPYAKCMKRAMVMALLMRDYPNIYLVIGVLPGKHTDGHAWLEYQGQIIAEAFDARQTPYREIRRVPIVLRSNTCPTSA